MIASAMVSLPVVLVALGARDLPTVLGSDAPVAAFLTAALGKPLALLVSGVIAVAIMNNLIAALLAPGTRLRIGPP